MAVIVFSRLHFALSASCSGQRVVSAAADVGAPRRDRDHEAEAHPDPAEQDRPGEGQPGEGAARADPQVCPGSVVAAHAAGGPVGGSGRRWGEVAGRRGPGEGQPGEGASRADPQVCPGSVVAQLLTRGEGGTGRGMSGTAVYTVVCCRPGQPAAEARRACLCRPPR